MTDEIKIQTFRPGDALPKNLILPQQSHSANVVKIETGFEDLTNCDGLWTQNKKFLIGVKTADCAPICIWSNEQFGIVHAGWRGVVNGVIENLLTAFEFEPSSNLVRTQNPETGLQFNSSQSSPTSLENRDRSRDFKIWIGPILPRFEIQRDECYEQIKTKFGDEFFNEIKVDLKMQKAHSNKKKSKSRSTLIFEFKKCLQFLLPQAEFDSRSTFTDKNLASWRRDKHFNKGQNITVIGSASHFS